MIALDMFEHVPDVCANLLCHFKLESVLESVSTHIE